MNESDGEYSATELEEDEGVQDDVQAEMQGGDGGAEEPTKQGRKRKGDKGTTQAVKAAKGGKASKKKSTQARSLTCQSGISRCSLCACPVLSE